MPEEAARSRLGRGLAALIGDVGDESAAVERTRGQRRVPIEFLRPNPRNPRKAFADADLDDLAASIRERGIIQPILVRTVAGAIDTYEIIAGERRWRAAQRAGQHEVPIILMEADDRLSLEIAIVENVQRSDLNALEEASGYERLMSEFSYSHSELAQVIGKSRSHVTNTIRLLKLPPGVKALLAENRLTAGHARALLTIGNAEELAKRIVAKDMTVREVERIAQREAHAGEAASTGRAPAAANKQADTRALEKTLENALGLTVAIEARAAGGELRIRYKTLEQLDMVCSRLLKNA